MFLFYFLLHSYCVIVSLRLFFGIPSISRLSSVDFLRVISVDEVAFKPIHALKRFENAKSVLAGYIANRIGKSNDSYRRFGSNRVRKKNTFQTQTHMENTRCGR